MCNKVIFCTKFVHFVKMNLKNVKLNQIITNIQRYKMSMNTFELFIIQIVKEYNLDEGKLKELWSSLVQQKCDYVVKKGMDGEHVCGKHVKLDGKCHRHLPTGQTIKDPSKCCQHIVKKKNGEEEQCNRLAKESGYCNKHNKGKVTNSVVCTHIIKKKDGSEEQCTRKVGEGEKYCKKHTKKSEVESELQVVENEEKSDTEEVFEEKSDTEEVVEEKSDTEEVIEEKSSDDETKPKKSKKVTIKYCSVKDCGNIIEKGKTCSDHTQAKKTSTKKTKKIVEQTATTVENEYDNLF